MSDLPNIWHCETCDSSCENWLTRCMWCTNSKIPTIELYMIKTKIFTNTANQIQLIKLLRNRLKVTLLVAKVITDDLYTQNDVRVMALNLKDAYDSTRLTTLIDLKKDLEEFGLQTLILTNDNERALRLLYGY